LALDALQLKDDSKGGFKAVMHKNKKHSKKHSKSKFDGG